MAYFTLDDLTALIPESLLTGGLDDDADGVQDAFAKVQKLAEDEVNGEIGRLYAVPFDVSNRAALAAFLSSLCVLIAVETIYARRGKELRDSQVNHLAKLRERLARIGNGEEKLNPEVTPQTDATAIISEPSKVWSRNTAC